MTPIRTLYLVSNSSEFPPEVRITALEGAGNLVGEQIDDEAVDAAVTGVVDLTDGQGCTTISDGERRKV
jgi:hypothetical protein